MKTIYMYAGGKNKMLKHYKPLFPKNHYKLYVEPFFGGGAVWANLDSLGVTADKYLVSDINSEIIGILNSIKEDSDGFIEKISKNVDKYIQLPTKDERRKYYYDLRQSYWDNPDSVKLYILMRLGFNGLWQTCEASHGLFGTASGLLNHKKAEQVYDAERIKQWAKKLGESTVMNRDYKDLRFPDNETLIYLDPPYRGSFTAYGTGFNDEHQKELVEWALERSSGGATVLLANRIVGDDNFFEEILGDRAEIHKFDVTYTLGRRKKNDDNTYSAKKAQEFLAIIPPV